MRRSLAAALAVLLLSGSIVEAAPAPDDPAPAPADEGRPPRKSFREACRTFAADGRYLFAFPARTNGEGVWLTSGFVAGTALLIRRDDEIRRRIVETDRRWAGRVATKFEPLGREYVEAAALGVFYWAARGSRDPRLIATAATSFEALLWSGAIVAAVKGVFGRDRPTDETDAHGFFSSDSIFPSGKTARSFAIASVLAERHGRKAAFIAYPAAALVGLSTVQQDTHWASDVLAGAGLGLAIGKGIAARHRAPGPAGRLDWRVLPSPGGAALALSF